jgi:hypothetical protein
MRSLQFWGALALVASVSVSGFAAEISGEYLEARTCDVYTGPCFANAEMGLTGNEAVLAWRVDQGGWNGVSLDGLGAALVLKAQDTLGNDGIFEMRAGRIDSVLLVDETATADQRQALVAFVKEAAPHLTENVLQVAAAPIKLENDHLAGVGVFSAGDVARIETRSLAKGDCVCTNEEIYYQPLTEVENSSPAYSKTLSFRGEGLDSQFTTHGTRSAFLATFRR